LNNNEQERIFNVCFVLSTSGYYNKISHTKWLKNNKKKHWFFIIEEAGKSKVKTPEDLVPGDDLLPCS
jgi:hypothetical protein